MTNTSSRVRFSWACGVAATCLMLATALARGGDVPRAGQRAPNFVLRSLAGETVELADLVKQGHVVLVVLRGWPGYQCPLCSRQVQDFIAQAAEFSRREANVVLIYPGPAEQLKTRATEFLADKQWPANFILALDPDHAFTRVYGLRWDAPRETAYPATFVIEQGGVIRFAHVSQSHGNRLSAARALAELH